MTTPGEPASGHQPSTEGIQFVEPSPGDVALTAETIPGAPPVQIFEAEAFDEKPKAADRPSLPVRLFRSLCAAAEWLFGLLSLTVFLAVLATVPILQLLSLGYLLEASGRVARSGRLREGLIGIKQAACLGSLVAGTWLTLLPLRYLSSVWYASNLIGSASQVTGALRVAQLIVTVLIVGHIVAAWYCGGRLRHFFWPLIAPFQLFVWVLRYLISTRFRPLVDYTIGLVSPRLVQDICSWKPLTDCFVPAILLKAVKSGQMYVRARDTVWEFVAGLRLPYLFWLGLRGFAGAMCWLALPVLLLIGATTLPQGAAILSGLLGSLLLAAVVLHLPYIQTHFAAENRWRAMFEIKSVYRTFWHAPIVWWSALVVTLLFAIPLYLLKIELTQAELAWLPSLAFVVFILPARLVTGWAVGRARRKCEKPHVAKKSWLKGCVRGVLRFGTFSTALPIALFYVLIVFISRYTNWYGVWGLFEQHAFLVPVPFFNL